MRVAGTGLAGMLLGLYEGEELRIGLENGDWLSGTITDFEANPPGKYFDERGSMQLVLDCSGTHFSLGLEYSEDDEGIPTTESLDLMLLGDGSWSISIEVPIKRIVHKST